LKNEVRREAARERAEAYAPRPQDTRFMYGTIAVSVLLIGMAVIGGFYDVDLWTRPWIIVLLVALAAAIGLLIRRLRMRRHRSAHRQEYDRHLGDARDGQQDVHTTQG